METQGSFFAWKKFCRKLFLKGGGYVYIFETKLEQMFCIRGLSWSKPSKNQFEHDSHYQLPNKKEE